MTISVTGFPASDPIPAIKLNVLLGQGTRSPGSGSRSIIIVAPRAYNEAGAAALGSATDAQIYPLYSKDDAETYFGAGSAHHRITKRLYETWGGCTVYGVSAAKGTGVQGIVESVLGAGPVVAGSADFYIGDYGPITITSIAAEAVDDYGARIESTLDACTELPVWTTYTAGTNTLKFTSKMPGADATGIKFRINNNTTGITFDGATTDSGNVAAGADGDLLTGGLVSAFDSIQASDVRYTYVLDATHTSSYITTAGLLEALIEDCCTADIGKRMVAVIGHNGTSADALAIADTLDSGTVAVDEGAFRFQLVWGSYNEAQPWEIAAEVCAMRAEAESSFINDNWVGIGGKVCPGLVPCVSSANYPTSTQLTSCLNGGVSPLTYDSEGQTVKLVRSISCKHETGEDNPDYRARDTNIIAVSDYVAYGLIDSLTDEFDGFTIADDEDDGNPPDNLANRQTTPSLIRQTIYRCLKTDYENTGCIENVDDNLDELVVERNTSNTQRVDAEIPVDVVRWLLQIGGNVREIGS